jgi:hypothetical protein
MRPAETTTALMARVTAFCCCDMAMVGAVQAMVFEEALKRCYEAVY